MERAPAGVDVLELVEVGRVVHHVGVDVAVSRARRRRAKSGMTCAVMRAYGPAAVVAGGDEIEIVELGRCFPGRLDGAVGARGEEKQLHLRRRETSSAPMSQGVTRAPRRHGT
jgi:hypothetical protein